MLVAEKMPRSISAEAYRILRTKIKYSSIDKIVKSIVITAADQGEGKSTVASNLAFTLSKSGNRVISIDCDLRKPSLHKYFGVSNVVGLTDYLVGTSELRDVTKELDDNLYLITAGTMPPNPAEVIASRKLESFINMLKNNYDYIIIDSPPVMAVTEPRILAAKSDATLLVVRAGKARAKVIKRSYEELLEVGANVIGTVLNDLDTKRKDNYYYYYEEESKKSRFFKRRKKRAY